MKTPDPLRDTIRDGARDASATSWWLVALGALWIWFGMFVLSYQVGSLVAVATFVGVAFLFGGITQLVVASRVPSAALAEHRGRDPRDRRRHRHLRLARHHPLHRVDPGGLVSDRLWHDPLVNALAGPKLSWWWTGLLLGISELVLGVWAARSWEHSLFTLVTLVGVWAICRGVNEIFAGFTLREVGKQADQLVA